MNITYKPFIPEYTDAVLELQHIWVYENITSGVVNETKEDILGYSNNYFYIAVDGEQVVGYINAEVVGDNKYNLFPMGANYIRVNDLYIRKEYRGNKIGVKLLSLIEKKACDNGIKHIFLPPRQRIQRLSGNSILEMAMVYGQRCFLNVLILMSAHMTLII
jgi:GNAT superfamily N-acetyltransferase